MNKFQSPRIRFVICTSLLLTLFSSLFASNSEMVLFHTDIAEDATPAVLAVMLEAKENGISEIKFEEGMYHFYPDKALEHLCYISNHEDVLARTAFPFFNFDNITIDGQGATFIFHGRMIPFIVEEGRNISIKNLSIDWDVPFHAEGLVLANNAQEKTVDLQFQDVDAYEIRNGELYFVKPYYEHTIGQNILFDPERRAVAYRANDYGVFTNKKVRTSHNVSNITYKYKGDNQTINQVWKGRQSGMEAQELSPGVVRIHNLRKQVPPVGTVVVAKGEKWTNRVSPAFRVTGVVNMKVEDVTVHHANGMGFICENSEDITLDGFKVTPSEGRMLSTTADATHFVGCRGKVVLQNCLFECQMDDATNVHGTYQEVMDIIDDYTLGVHVGHNEQQMFKIGRKGDKIGLVRLSNSFEPYSDLTIKSIQIINGRYQKITFNEALPAAVQAGDLIENLDAYPDLVVQNCTIRGNRARGLLISTPKSTLIQNNFFHTQMEAILVPVESSSWFESGSAANLTIKNNVFQDCNHGGQERGIIRFHTDDDNDNTAFRNIEISDNSFNMFDNIVLELGNTDGFLFKNNTVINSGTFPQLYPNSPAFKIKSSKNVEFKNNTYSGKAKTILETDGLNPKLKFE